MSIFGLGTEIVEVSRIARMIDRHGEAFLRRVFTDREMHHCHQLPGQTLQLFAERWAGKVAVLRALGFNQPRSVGEWVNLEIASDGKHRPTVRVGGSSRALLQQLGIGEVLVSLAHCRQHATATALALRGEEASRAGR